MNISPFPLHLIRIDLRGLAPLLIKKLQAYVELFDTMEQHDGWLPYPTSVRAYFKELGVMHWAELYSKDGQERWMQAHHSELGTLFQYLVDSFGSEPTLESVNGFLNDYVSELSKSSGPVGSVMSIELDRLMGDLSAADDGNLSDEERRQRRDIWIGYHVQFYNDLSTATHSESIFTLVNRAINNDDANAMVMAIQIDRSLLPFFQNHFWEQAMGSNSNFWDSVAYRINNPPIRGRNKYPLLWILFKDLQAMRCLGREVTSRKILDLYGEAVGEHPRFAIDDELIVQRQRRKFVRMYRQLR